MESDLDFYRTFVNRLIESIAEDGRTPTEISRAAGLKSNTASVWIQGRRRIDMAALVKLADELCISIDWLLGRKDDQKL